MTTANSPKLAVARDVRDRNANNKFEGFAEHRQSRSRRLGDLSVLKLDQTLEPYPSTLLRFQQARAISEILAVVGLPAGVLSALGEVIAVNKLFAALVPRTLRALHGRPQLIDAHADRLMGNAIARLNSAERANAAVCIPVRGRINTPPAIVSLVPLCASAEEVLLDPAAVLVVKPVQPPPALDAKILQDLFGLSPAEARVAQCVAGRETIKMIAGRSGVSRETVRCQLKAVLAKTRTKRQLDLAVLLAGSGLTP